MMPKIMCSQRSTIISLTCAPAEKEKCGGHRGKAAKRFCGSIKYLAARGLSSKNTVADFVRKGQPGPQGTNRGKLATMACWLVEPALATLSSVPVTGFVTAVTVWRAA